MKYCPLLVKQQYEVFWNKNELTLEIIEISIVILDKSAPVDIPQNQPLFLGQCFEDLRLSFCLLVIVLSVLFSFGHCVVCPFVFWSLCCLSFCLQVIVLSVLLSFGHCVVCPFVFWSLCCLSFIDLRILIFPFVHSNSSYVKLGACVHLEFEKHPH